MIRIQYIKRILIAMGFVIMSVSLWGYSTVSEECFLQQVPVIDTLPLDRGDHMVEDAEIETKAIARAYNDSIIVRWYPPAYYSWKLSISKGYTVKKYFADSDVLIKEFNVTHWDSSQYMQHIEATNNTEMLLAASIIYGKQGEDEIEELVENEKRNLYGFALIKGFEYPKMMESIGLQFTDRDVVKGESYRYVITRIEKAFNNDIISCAVTINNEFIPLPNLKNINIDSSHLSVDMLIDIEANEEEYVMYRISKAENENAPFAPVTSSPIMFSDDSIKVKTATYNVPVDENYINHYFSVEGMNMFGEYSKPALLQGYGVDTVPPPAPEMEYPQVIDSNIVMTWTAIAEPNDFAGYKVQLGDTPFGEYENVSDMLPSGTESYLYPIDENTGGLMYFRIAAYDIHGNYSSSLGSNVIFKDSIPPDAPTNLKGVVTDEGYVTITWDKSVEELSGYRVYFSNDSTYEFSQVSNELFTENTFSDTLALNMLADEIYYIIEAEDRSYNRSEYSKVLTVKRPDILPPVAPVILPTESNGDGVIVNWRASTSYDVVMHYLYRKQESESIDDWILLDSLPFFGENYVDSTAQIEVLYEYRVQAMDDVGLRSDFTLAVAGRRYFDGDIDVISDLAVEFQDAPLGVKISWLPKANDDEFLASKDYRYVIYRGTNPDELSRLVQLIDKTPQFIDNDIELDNDYFYAIQLLYEDGKKSKISAPVFITLK